MRSANNSAEASRASANTLSALSEESTNILEQVQELSSSVTQQEEEVVTANAINQQTASDRDSAASAVEQLRARLSALDLVDSSELDEVRQLVSQTRSKYESADLSGVYQTLTERLAEQRAVRMQLEADLDALTDDIEHLRRVNRALPDPRSGCGEGA